MSRYLPQVHFGHVGAKPKNWRDSQLKELDDDSELLETPPDVLAMLGFDPKDIDMIEQRKNALKHKGSLKPISHKD